MGSFISGYCMRNSFVLIRSHVINPLRVFCVRLTAKEDEMSSIHSGNITEVHDVPMSVIIRPLVPSLDENKVLSLMETLQDSEKADKVPPIDILWVKGREQGDYYYSFGGCHRFEAYKRLNRETVPCKIVKSTVEDIRVYLGSSMPDLK